MQSDIVVVQYGYLGSEMGGQWVERWVAVHVVSEMGAYSQRDRWLGREMGGYVERLVAMGGQVEKWMSSYGIEMDGQVER